ncbi:hypothetical protein C8J56DRAFT_1158562 [Mycena floridula]|nr:hypothetical protein C8J56DRAFT_1158562 [Mycena floridula]
MAMDCTADIEQYVASTGQYIMVVALPMIVGAVFWTLYTASVVLTVVVLWRKGFSRARIVLLTLVAVMFLLDTGAFASALFGLFYQTREMLLKHISGGADLLRVQNPVVTEVTIVKNVLSLIMLVPGDCIVIWRAYAVSSWVRSRFIMLIPPLLLLGCIGNIPVFAICNIKHREDIHNGLVSTACFPTMTSGLVLSFCTNISATLIICYTAWSYYISQRILRETPGALRPRFSPVARTLQLFVESGFAYLLVMTFGSAMTLWSLSPRRAYGSAMVVNEVLFAITTHSVAMVPTLTILLVTVYGSFDEHPTLNISQTINFHLIPRDRNVTMAMPSAKSGTGRETKRFNIEL